jgi:hypothetical protein
VTAHRIIALLLTSTVCLMLLSLVGLPVRTISPDPYEPFEDYLKRITGAKAVDCGVLEPDATAVEMQSALDCGLRAARSARAFRLIKGGYGFDSIVLHGLARGRVGPIVRFSYDSMGPFTARPCDSPVVTTELDGPFDRPKVPTHSFECAL